MVRSLSGLLILFTSVGVLPATGTCPSPADSAVHIRRDTAEGWNAGSGTVVACEGGKSLILTCSHVVPDGGTKLTATVSDKAYEAEYLAGSKVTEVPHPTVPKAMTIIIEGPDLSLIVVKAKLPVAPLSDKPAKKGDVVNQWGFAGGKTLNGPFQKIGKVIEEEAVWVSADARRGDSGCGLFNVDGKLIGVVHSRSADEDEVGGLAVPLSTIRKFLSEKAVGFPTLTKSLNTKK